MTPVTPIGTVGFDGPRDRTFARLDAVELQDSFRGAPGERLLGRLRRDAGDRFAFVLHLPVALSDPQGPGAGPKRPHLPYLPEGAWPEAPFDTGELGLAAWQWVLGAAERIDARAIFLQTGPSFRPTAQNRRRLSDFFAQVPRPHRVVWDSQGLFSREDQAALCRELNLVPAVDPLVDPLPKDGHAYLRTVGRSRTKHGLSADELERLAEAVEELAWGLVILHTPSPYRDATALKKLLGSQDSPGEEPEA